MFTTIALAILLVLAIVLYLLAKGSKRRATADAAEHNADFDNPETRNEYGAKRATPKPWADKFGYIPTYVVAVPLTIFVLWGLLACTTTIDAKTEGVLLTFKAPSDRLLDSGLRIKAPWQDVVEIDGTRKTDNFNDGKPNDPEDATQDHGAIQCRLGDNGVSKVKVSVQWARAEGTSNRVYEQYRAEDPVEEMRENLVVPLFRDAVNAACADYRPTGVIDGLNIDFTDPKAVSAALNGLKLAPDFAALAKAAKAGLEDRLSKGGTIEPLITVESVSWSYLELPKSSQEKIDQFLNEVNKTRIALQAQATNTAQAAANEILSESISNDPNVLVSRCLDLIEDGKLILPAGGSCWPGGGSGVVIPSSN
jgi:SPFH domain/Band 7 family protein